MLPSFIIMFREVLEAALVVGIVLGYLARTKQTQYNKFVHAGIGAGIAGSIVGALLFVKIAGGFSGRAEAVFEGVAMLVGALLLTTMILWVMRQKHLARELEEKVSLNIGKASSFGLFLLVFVAILREGIESVIFLGAARFASPDSNLIGAVLGVVVAAGLGYALYKGAMRMHLKKFFTITNVMLILFAAGLVSHGIHELQEAAIVPTIVEHVWDINPAVVGGQYPLLHEKGYIGSVLKGLFGYNGNPSLIEVLSYLVYLGLASAAWLTIKRQASSQLQQSQ